MSESYWTKYSCGCEHELERNTSQGNFMYQPTGKKRNQCKDHK